MKTTQDKISKKEYDKERYLKNREKILENYLKNKKNYSLKRKIQYQNNKEKISEQRKEKYHTNKEKILKQHKDEYLRNKENRLNQKKHYYLQNKEKIILKQQKYYFDNKNEISKQQLKYTNKRKKEDINFKLSCNLRGRLYHAIKDNQKLGSAVQDLGCTVPELKLYLESKFQEGMTWGNWSPDGWHIDHIIPLASFDLSNREEFLKANHYTNLQPLWAEENFLKKDKII